MNRRTFLRRMGAALAVAAVPPILHRLPDESRKEPGIYVSISASLMGDVPTSMVGWHIDGVGFFGAWIPKGDGWHHIDVYASRAVVRSYVDGKRTRPMLSQRVPAGLQKAYRVTGMPGPFPEMTFYAPAVSYMDDIYVVDGAAQKIPDPAVLT